MKINQEKVKIFKVNNTSLKKFKVKGAEILLAEKISHHKVKEGNTISIPLLIIIFREPLRSYKKLTKKNKHEDLNPWAIIIIRDLMKVILISDM